MLLERLDDPAVKLPPTVHEVVGRAILQRRSKLGRGGVELLRRDRHRHALQAVRRAGDHLQPALQRNDVDHRRVRRERLEVDDPRLLAAADVDAPVLEIILDLGRFEQLDRVQASSRSCARLAGSFSFAA